MTEAESGDSETITLHELLERSARSALDLQREDGSFPPGRNYHYDEPKLPVGTTSHWLLTFTEVYDHTNEGEFKEAARGCVDYLLSNEARPHDYTFHSRNAESKDSCNGVIGQSGPIRALARAGDVFGWKDAKEMAREVFFLLPFDQQLGLWERIEIDGKNLSFDRTLNHQIIFAARAAELHHHDDQVNDRITRFLDRLEANLSLRSDGRIVHYVRPSVTDVVRKLSTHPRYYSLMWNEIANIYCAVTDRLLQKERGYHPLNMKGLALLYDGFPSHSFWNNEMFEQAMDYLVQNESGLIDGHKTTGGTLMPEIAVAIVYSKFDVDRGTDVERLLNIAIDERLNQKTFMLESEGVDPADMAAQISQFSHLYRHC